MNNLYFKGVDYWTWILPDELCGAPLHDIEETHKVFLKEKAFCNDLDEYLDIPYVYKGISWKGKGLYVWRNGKLHELTSRKLDELEKQLYFSPMKIEAVAPAC